MFWKCHTISVSDLHSTPLAPSLRSLKPEVTTPTLSLSRTHWAAYLKSSQVSGCPSDHFRPSRRVHVTVIASPLSPGALTPPLSTVGTLVARSGAYR